LSDEQLTVAMRCQGTSGVGTVRSRESKGFESVL
jgi:hypothetical protein